ncbi:MAG: EamA family transporter [Ferrovibrio sp.]|uniref:aromatic amino acid exporter YddG n=1 Tax=Ferrovibrio sp. TaxID=1917215 RepID=UPI0026029A6A|nr:EamA family transporter [Ferrovibrio sp.]MCW0233632.1 EamA family transporter [Ferrovibrio sp.]
MTVSTAAQSKLRATLIGTIAILLWASLALFTTLTPSVPALQLTAMTFSLSALAAIAMWLLRGDGVLKHFRLAPAAWALGVCGLFGYHALYFLALKLAPPLEASLINYLWPLLIVLFSALLPGERLRWFHLAGAACGLVGTVILIAGKGELGFDWRFAAGYAAAFACAFTWSGYSVLSRRFATVPTDAVGAFCAATAVLSWIGHFMFETTAWPADLPEWAAVIALGLGPVGLAFFCWDHGMKRGDVRALGTMAYAAPLLSTLLLILFGQGALTLPVIAACALIVGGAVLGTADLRSHGGRR